MGTCRQKGRMKSIQLSMFPNIMPKYQVDHGGDIRKGRRKLTRPFSAKHAIHVVFRSTRARGHWSLLTRKNEALIKKLLARCATRHHIKVYRFVNVGNHLHLLVKTRSNQYFLGRAHFARFLREFGGAVAISVTGAKKAAPKGGFWEKRVYSRIVSWGREYDRLKEYFVKNLFESTGFKREQLEPVLKSLFSSLRAAGVGPPQLGLSFSEH